MSDTTPVKPIILAIDDAPEILDIVRLTLEEEGMMVITASTAAEGLRIYDDQYQTIDLVLVDYALPDMTGDLAFESIMRVNPYAKVMLLTGYDDQIAQRMLAHGLRGYIGKPFHLDELVNRVREELATP